MTVHVYIDNEGYVVEPGMTYAFRYNHEGSDCLVVYSSDGSFYDIEDYDNPGTIPVEEDFDFLVRQRLPINKDFT